MRELQVLCNRTDQLEDIAVRCLVCSNSGRQINDNLLANTGNIKTAPTLAGVAFEPAILYDIYRYNAVVIHPCTELIHKS